MSIALTTLRGRGTGLDRVRPVVRRLLRHPGLLRSRPVGSNPSNPSEQLLQLQVRFCGRVLDLTVRRGTTDEDLIDMILSAEGSYRLPTVVRPRVIFDVGANIGIATVYFASMYPEAQVYCFEPLPANLELLRANISGFGDRIHVFARGLSDVAGSFEYRMSGDQRSYGGGTFCGIGADSKRSLTLPVGTVGEALDEIGLKEVDVFKLDTEGSEWSILKGIPEQVRNRTQAFVGELHGVSDWDFCALLSKTHALELHKPYDRNCYPFMALRQDLV